MRSQFHGEIVKINSQFAELVDNLAAEAQSGAFSSGAAIAQQVLTGNRNETSFSEHNSSARSNDDIKYNGKENG